MIQIFYTEFFDELKKDHFIRLLDRLPPIFHQKIMRFKRWEDRQASLFGKLLLLEGLSRSGIEKPELGDMQYTSFGRPYLPANPEFDFNISHTKKCVLCALGRDCRVGADVEEVVEIELDDFRNQWTSGEWLDILHSADRYDRFYHYWTRKEAVIKADGQGLSIPLQSLDVSRDDPHVEGQQWFLKKVDLFRNHIVHIATDRELNGEIQADFLDFNYLI